MAMEQESASMHAGGRATEAGMAFQAAVATWFAVHILVRMPVGGRFGINNQALPVAIRLETGEGLDDIEVSQSDEGAIHIQCKTRANLSDGPRAPLAKTVGQLTRWVANAKAADGLPNLTRNVALLAVRADAPRTLNDLESGCRAFDLGGGWATTCTQRNQAERRALATFGSIAIPEWTAHCGSAPVDGDLTDLARIFRVARFTMDEGDSDWREASRLLGRHLFGGEGGGDAPLRDLTLIMRGLISSGAPADRDGLLRALRQRGHQDVGSPGFESDVARLQAVTESELARLAAHGRLPLGPGVPINRESAAPLVAAILAGSLLVVGEPGAGKTGALVHAAVTIASTGGTVVFLSVDRFPGASIAADLASELRLAHPLVDTLAAMPGASRKILFIDALDASRGGPSETVFAALIEEVRDRLANDWIVVASMRTFDVKNGRRFRLAFSGAPANPDHAEAGLSTVRHFLVPRLSEVDLTTVSAASPIVGALLASAPSRLMELLRNIFNLSLAAQLLAEGSAPSAIREIGTQSGLIDAYEDARLSTTSLQQAAGVTAEVMTSRRRLSVRKVVIRHDNLDEVIRSGVLSENGDLVSFAHHVLFDHIAGRFHLAWDEPDRLIAQLEGDTSSAIFLAPALRFAIERLWRFDGEGKSLSWQLIFNIFSAERVDAVLGNIAIRVAVENIEGEGDITGLCARIATPPSEAVLAQLLARLAHFAKMSIESSEDVASSRAIAWARLAEILISSGSSALAYPARVLLHVLFEHVEFADAVFLDTYGRAARTMLEMAWSASPPQLAISSQAIRFVGKSFASNPGSSRALLDRVLRDPHFSQCADREARWLAEQIIPITRVDPQFTTEIYAALYGQAITDNTTSSFGGQQSRIMPLSSNRQQDFNGCRWLLGTKMGHILTLSPEHGTRALIDAVIGQYLTRGYGCGREPDRIQVGSATIELRGHTVEFRAWDQEPEGGRVNEDDLLRHYVRFLQDCDSTTFALSVAAASRVYSTGAVWTRIFGVGSTRVAEVGDILWPLIERPDFFENKAIVRDAIKFVAAAWSTRSREARIRFETMVLDVARFSDESSLHRWHFTRDRILAAVPENALELEATRELRRSIDTAGSPPANDSIQQSAADDFVRDQLRRAGVNMDTGPNQLVYDASDTLYVRIQQIPSDSPVQDLAVLWREAMELVALIDANPGLDDQVDRAAWGHVSNAVERIASSPNYTPGAVDLPDLVTMFAVLNRLSASRYPDEHENER